MSGGNPQKLKGDRAEREAIQVLAGLGLRAQRRFGAGQSDDEGDLMLGTMTTIQVRDYADFGRACIDAANDAEHQAERGGRALGVGMARRRGGRFVMTLTPESFAWLVDAAGLVERSRR